MQGEPLMLREAGVTYCVPPFTYQEQIYVSSYRMVPVRYAWKYVPMNRTGFHVVYVFPEDVKNVQKLIDHWNGYSPFGGDWQYSLTLPLEMRYTPA